MKKKLLVNNLIFISFLLLTVFVLTLIFIKRIYWPPFSPDSWTYYELSKNIFKDFYRINTYRQYQHNSPYGISFPPLTAVIIAIFNSVFHASVYGGYFLNFIFALITLLLFIIISKLIFKSPYFGFAIFLLLLNNPNYVDEIVSARSIPLSILLILITFIIIINAKLISFKEVVLLSLFSGLGILNRFDFIFPALSLGVIIIIITKKQLRFKYLLSYYLLLTIAISPWIIYSYRHFSKLFISDNSLSVIAATFIHNQDYYPNITMVATVFNSPVRWFLTMIKRPLITLDALLQTVVNRDFFLLLMFSQLLLLIQLFKRLDLALISYNKKKLTRSLQLILLVVAYFVTFSLSEHNDLRYFIFSDIYFKIIIYSIIVFVALRMFGSRTIFYLNLILFLLLFYNLSRPLRAIPLYVKIFIKSKQFLNPDNIDNPPSYKNMVSLINQTSKNKKPKILIDYTDVSTFKFGALTGIDTFPPPANINECLLNKVINDYHITHIYTNCTLWKNYINKYYSTKSYLRGKLLVIDYKLSSNKFTNCSITKDISLWNCASWF